MTDNTLLVVVFLAINVVSGIAFSMGLSQRADAGILVCFGFNCVISGMCFQELYHLYYKDRSSR